MSKSWQGPIRVASRDRGPARTRTTSPQRRIRSQRRPKTGITSAARREAKLGHFSRIGIEWSSSLHVRLLRKHPSSLIRGGKCSSCHPHWLRIQRLSSDGHVCRNQSEDFRAPPTWNIHGSPRCCTVYGQRTTVPEHAETQAARQERVLPTYTMRACYSRA